MALEFLPPLKLAEFDKAEYTLDGMYKTSHGVATEDANFDYILEVRVIKDSFKQTAQIMYEIPKVPQNENNSLGVYERVYKGNWRVVSSDAWSDVRALDTAKEFTHSKTHIDDEIGRVDVTAKQGVTDAGVAKGIAEQAKTDAATAQTTAQQGVDDAASAMTEAGVAKGLANQGIADADAAKKLAEKGIEDAKEAKEIADQAALDIKGLDTQVKPTPVPVTKELLNATEDPVLVPSARQQGLVVAISGKYILTANSKVVEIMSLNTNKLFAEDEPIEIVAQLDDYSQSYEGVLTADGMIKLPRGVDFPAGVEIIINALVMAMA